MSAWKKYLPGFDMTHHQLGPLDIEVRGDSATVRTDVTAIHQIAGVETGMHAVHQDVPVEPVVIQEVRITD